MPHQGHPVTVLVSRKVRSGHEAEFEHAMDGMLDAATRFEGHLGGYLITPEPGRERHYQTLFAFDTDPLLRVWLGSPERRSWLDRIAMVSDGEDSLRTLSGLEGWFALPGARTRNPPRKHRMAFVTWLGIFPLVLVISQSVGPWLAPINPVLSIAVVTALVTVVMTWMAMPALGRLFAAWLYPEN